MHHALVIGGSGFVGSAVCRACVARGWSVTSLSRSGDDRLRGLNRPTWADKISWQKGSFNDAQLLQELLPQATAVVHTLGILLESDYKSSVSSLANGLLRGLRDNLLDQNSKNPLRISRNVSRAGKYETINRDSALMVARTYVDCLPSVDSGSSTYPFVYVSAEDVFRPFVPARYISTKREAEAGLAALEVQSNSRVGGNVAERRRSIRPIFVRPSLMYHPSIRPLSMIGALPLKIATAIHEHIPSSLHLHNIAHELSSHGRQDTPLGSEAKNLAEPGDLPPIRDSFFNLLSMSPLHVDAVAEAICDAIEDVNVRGVIGVRNMLRMEQKRHASEDRSSESGFSTNAKNG